MVYKTAEHHPNGTDLMTVNADHPMYDPLMYVLMFPFGDKGYEFNIYISKGKKRRITAIKYYRYRLMPLRGDTF